MSGICVVATLEMCIPTATIRAAKHPKIGPRTLMDEGSTPGTIILKTERSARNIWDWAESQEGANIHG